MFVAYYLRKGGYEVSLVDKDQGGREASVFNAGLLTPSFAPTPQFSKVSLLRAVLHASGPLYISPRQILAQPSWFMVASRKALTGFEGPILRMGQKSLELYQEFFESEGIKADIVKGVLGLYRARVDAETFCEKFGGDLLSPAEIGGMGFRGLGGGVMFASEYSINPAKLFSEMRRRLQAMGVEVVLGREARLKFDGTKGSCLIDGEPKEAGLVIVAAGSWTQRLLSRAGFNPQVVPARGLVQIYDTGGRVAVPKPVLLEDYGIGVVQHDKSTLRVTSFFEMVGLNRRLGEGRRGWLADVMARHVTDLSKFKLVEEGIGFRPCTPDQFPVVGRLPGYENVCVASGNCRLGVTLAPATAYLLKSIIEGTGFMEDLRKLVSPTRFSR